MALYGDNKFIEPDRRKTRLRTGLDHEGKPRALAQPGDKVLGTHHTAANIARGQEHQQTEDTIARKSSTMKVHLDVPIHSGMTPMQQQLKGMGHAVGSAPDASSANPLDPTAPGKCEKPLMVHPSMTRQQQTSAIFNGEKVLSEAVKCK
jgi:hypothetical protein